MRKKGRETSMCGCLSCALLGTWPATQACALTGNQTSDPVVYRPVLNPLSYTSQGTKISYTRAERVSPWRISLEFCFLFLLFLKNNFITPASVVQRTECQPANQRVTGLIPRQGTCRSCKPGPQVVAHE